MLCSLSSSMGAALYAWAWAETKAVMAALAALKRPVVAATRFAVGVAALEARFEEVRHEGIWRSQKIDCRLNANTNHYYLHYSYVSHWTPYIPWISAYQGANKAI
jgi:hypothetical protein